MGRQTRRTISVSKTLYDRLTIFCEVAGTNRSRLTEKLLREHMDSTPNVSIEMYGPVERRTFTPTHAQIEEAKIAIRRKAAERAALRAKDVPTIDTVKNPCRKERCSIERIHEEHT